MSLRKRSALILVGIIFLAILAAIFALPSLWGNKFKPWRLGSDLAGGTDLEYIVDMTKVEARDRSSVMTGLRDVIEKRVNLFGVAEPQVFAAKEGDNYKLIIKLAGIKDIGGALDQIGSTPLLDFREIVGDATNSQIVASELTGRYVTGASLGSDPAGFTTFEFELNKEGAKIFEDLTERNVGKALCIFIDNQPIFSRGDAENSLRMSCPRVNEKISDGKALISGGDINRNTALELVQKFNAGALPAPIKLLNQRTVSATLGVDSLNKAIYAGLIGVLAVVVFMLIYYRFLGIFSAAALIIYVVFNLAVFKAIGVTMTLSGIAGFILSIGMAVDANILIFERTKEEVARGVSFVSAIEEGFRRAWPSIRDSNFTTLISAAILYYYTSSFVQGFAFTLFIGVLLSMFSAITVTRVLLRAFITDRKARM